MSHSLERSRGKRTGGQLGGDKTGMLASTPQVGVFWPNTSISLPSVTPWRCLMCPLLPGAYSWGTDIKVWGPWVSAVRRGLPGLPGEALIMG